MWPEICEIMSDNSSLHASSNTRYHSHGNGSWRNAPEVFFSYLRQDNSTGRGVPTFSVWYRACLSGTGCLVLPFVLLFIYISNYNVTTQSATFPATSEGYHDVKENIIGIFLLKMHISMRYEKNNQIPVLNPDWQISVSGDKMSHPSLGYRPRLIFVTSYHPRLRFVTLDPTLVLDSINPVWKGLRRQITTPTPPPIPTHPYWSSSISIPSELWLKTHRWNIKTFEGRYRSMDKNRDFNASNI